MSGARRHDPSDHDCRGGVPGDLYPLDVRINFASFDGGVEARIGHGDHCLLVQIVGPTSTAGIVFTDDEADAFARGVLRQVAYSREVRSPAAELLVADPAHHVDGTGLVHDHGE